MPLFDHLGELRMRLVRIVACLAIAVVVFYMATPTMGQFLLQPIFDFLPKNADGSLALIALDPFESFATRFKISIWASIVACSPVILWQILAFFLPALKPKERKWFVPTFGAAVALFVFGTVFCYLVILNPAFEWLTDQAAGLGEIAPRMSSYIDMIIKFEIGFGFAFARGLRRLAEAPAGRSPSPSPFAALGSSCGRSCTATVPFSSIRRPFLL